MTNPGPAGGATKAPSPGEQSSMPAGGRRPGPRPVQVGAESALGGRLGTVVASAPSAVSTPPRHSQRPRHPSRQCPVAPESVGAPPTSSVPHRARVSGRAICRSQYPGSTAAGGAACAVVSSWGVSVGLPEPVRTFVRSVRDSAGSSFKLGHRRVRKGRRNETDLDGARTDAGAKGC